MNITELIESIFVRFYLRYRISARYVTFNIAVDMQSLSKEKEEEKKIEGALIMRFMPSMTTE